MSENLTPPRGGFDDERLLAFALGLDDDAELAAGLESSPQLRQRLEQVCNDVSLVSDRLQAEVPAVDSDYSDPAAARWQRLHGFYVPASSSPRRAGAWRLGRVAPIAAVIAIFAVAVGIAVQQMPGGTDTSAQKARSAGDFAPAGAPGDKGLAGESYAGGMIMLPQAEHFRTVVVARAGEVVEDLQSFNVLRILKGRVADRIRLAIGSGAAALPVGSLEVLYMRPLGDFAWATEPGEPAAATAGSGSPLTPQQETMPVATGGYTMGDYEAYVQPVPSGVEVSALAVP